MYDGFTFKTKDLSAIQSLRERSQLDFKGFTSFSSGEADPILYAKHRGLIIKHFDNGYKSEMLIRGSFPRYIGKTNYQNMTIEESQQAVADLLNDLGLPADATEVIKLEYGQNFSVRPEIPANRFINNIVTYKGGMPTYKGYDNGGMLVEFGLDEFGAKIYNKSAQQGINSNVVRAELSLNRKRQLNDLGIYTASDLLSNQATKALQKKLLYFTKHLIFYDFDLPAKNLTKRQLVLFLEYCKADAWKKLQDNNPDLYRKKKWSFANHVTEASGIDWNQLFYDGIANESSKLLQSPEKAKTCRGYSINNEIYSPAYC